MSAITGMFVTHDRLPRQPEKRYKSYMSLSAAELDALITDLTNHYVQLSHEYSEIVDEERKEEIADALGSIEYQLARLEEERKILGNVSPQAMRAG